MKPDIYERFLAKDWNQENYWSVSYIVRKQAGLFSKLADEERKTMTHWFTYPVVYQSLFFPDVFSWWRNERFKLVLTHMCRQNLHIISHLQIDLKLLVAPLLQSIFSNVVHLAVKIQSRVQAHLLCLSFSITLEIQSDLYIYEATQTLVTFWFTGFFSTFWEYFKQINPFPSLPLPGFGSLKYNIFKKLLGIWRIPPGTWVPSGLQTHLPSLSSLRTHVESHPLCMTLLRFKSSIAWLQSWPKCAKINNTYGNVS